MSLIYQGHARALDADFILYDFDAWVEFSRLPKVLDDGYDFINTVNHKIAIPDIITLTKYDRLPQRDIKFSRENIFARDDHICQYCGKKFKRESLTIDHVIPKCRGGTNHWNNTVASCKKCNNLKGDRTPEQVGLKLLRKPTEPKWFNTLHKIVSVQGVRPSWKKFLSSVGF